MESFYILMTILGFVSFITFLILLSACEKKWHYFGCGILLVISLTGLSIGLWRTCEIEDEKEQIELQQIQEDNSYILNLVENGSITSEEAVKLLKIKKK